MLKDKLNYSVARSTASWSSTTSSVCDLDRMISGSDTYWLKEGESFLYKKKTIIIYIPRFIYLDNTKTQLFFLRFDSLLKQGYALYVYNNTNFIPYDHSIFYYNPSNDIFSRDELIQKTINELHLIYDEIYIVDDENKDELINGDDEEWQQLPSVKQANLAESCIRGESLIHLLDEQGDQIELLDLSNCINLSQVPLKPLKLPQLNTLILGTKGHSNNSPNVNNLPAEFIHQLITDTSHTLEVINLNGLVQLKLDTLKLLLNSKRIKELSLAYCQFLEDDDLFNDFDSSTLEVLNLNKTTIAIKTLAKLLNNSPRLRELNIGELSIINLNQHLDCTFSLNQLRILHLSCAYINCESVKMLIASAVHLEELHADSLRQVINDASETPLRLPKLRVLNISTIAFTNRFIYQLFSAASSIEELHINGLDLLSLHDLFKFPLLKRLIARDAKIDISVLFEALVNSPHLEELVVSIHNALIHIDTPLPKLLPLTALQRLNIEHRSAVNNQHVYDIMSNAPYLKKATIVNHLSSHASIGPTPVMNLNLKALEDLVVKGKDINSTLLAVASRKV